MRLGNRGKMTGITAVHARLLSSAAAQRGLAPAGSRSARRAEREPAAGPGGSALDVSRQNAGERRIDFACKAGSNGRRQIVALSVPRRDLDGVEPNWSARRENSNGTTLPTGSPRGAVSGASRLAVCTDHTLRVSPATARLKAPVAERPVALPPATGGAYV
jgi:hypothetical protein